MFLKHVFIVLSVVISLFSSALIYDWMLLERLIGAPEIGLIYHVVTATVVGAGMVIGAHLLRPVGSWLGLIVLYIHSTLAILITFLLIYRPEVYDDLTNPAAGFGSFGLLSVALTFCILVRPFKAVFGTVAESPA